MSHVRSRLESGKLLIRTKKFYQQSTTNRRRPIPFGVDLTHDVVEYVLGTLPSLPIANLFHQAVVQTHWTGLSNGWIRPHTQQVMSLGHGQLHWSGRSATDLIDSGLQDRKSVV